VWKKYGESSALITVDGWRLPPIDILDKSAAIASPPAPLPSARHSLDRASINLKREQVYIANVIKCQPSGNRDPLPSEIHNCRKWLERQIELIHPRMIVTLGRYSMAMFFPGKRSISKIHGTAQKRDNVIYYAMYHPAATLHQQSLRQAIETDMLKIPSLLAQAETVPAAKQQPQQLNMFKD